MVQQSTALVLGASRGLGLALTREWCEHGWHVTATVRTASNELAALGRGFPCSLKIETARAGCNRHPRPVVIAT